VVARIEHILFLSERFVPGGRPKTDDRATVTAAAMELFWKRGYHDVSTRELVDAMGINMNTLYTEFGTKAGLFSAAFANALPNSAVGAPDVTAMARLLTTTMLGVFVMIRAQTSARLLHDVVDTALDDIESKLD